MIDILWAVCLILFGISFVFAEIASNTWSYARERTYAKLAFITILCSLVCGALAIYITSKTCEDSVVAKATGISDRCYKGENK